METMTEHEFRQLLTERGYDEIRETTYEPDSSNELHTHEFSALLLVLEGEFILEREDVVAVVGARHDRIVVASIDPFSALNDQLRVGEGEHDLVAVTGCRAGFGCDPVRFLSFACAPCQTPGVIKVQV